MEDDEKLQKSSEEQECIDDLVRATLNLILEVGGWDEKYAEG